MTLELSEVHFLEKLGEVGHELHSCTNDAYQKRPRDLALSVLARRGFYVKIAHRSYRRAQTVFYCRIRNKEIDQTFQGATIEIALGKAIESLPPESETTG